MKILFLTTEDSTFWSHRLALARATREAGAEVVIMARWGEYCERLQKEGFRVIPWKVSRRSLNPFREFYSFLQVLKVYREERPDLVHHVALKPIAYGGSAARLWRGIPAVNSVTGLGPVFIHSRPLMRAVRRCLTTALHWVFGASNCHVVFQNYDDRDLLVAQGTVPREKTVVVPGFGVDTENFVPLPEPGGVPIVMLPSRMLWEKGIREFVEAAAALRQRGVAARMVLVGAPDPNNPGCIGRERLKEWEESGVVEWWGKRNNMPAVLGQAQVICLPSYREGVPKVLLEAAACARPIVTTNAPGCSLAVRQGENGFLVPVKDSEALAAAITDLLRDRALRKKMGAAGRARAVQEFSEQRIARQMLDVYQFLLNHDGGSPYGRDFLGLRSLGKQEGTDKAVPQQAS